MNAPMTDIKKLAEGLTPAQRRAINGAFETLLGERWLLSAKAHPKVIENLRRKGLSEDHDPYRDRLTPLGASVRAYLKENERG